MNISHLGNDPVTTLKVSFEKISIKGFDDFVSYIEKQERMITGYCLNSFTFQSFPLLTKVIIMRLC